MKEKTDYVHKSLKNSPKGTILIAKEGNFTRISRYQSEGDKQFRVGIKRNPALISALAQKAIFKEYAKRLDWNLALLSDSIAAMLPMDEQSIYKSAPANLELIVGKYLADSGPSQMHPVYANDLAIRDFVSYIPEDRKQSWASEPYRANSFNLESKLHKTIDGIAFRSKSELALFEIYRQHGFPVHYDQVIKVGGQLKSPDFISMRQDGKVIIHEHCGLVNDPNYIRTHNEKIRLYESYGITPWNNLIVTYDDPRGGIDLKLAEAEICSKLEF